MFSPSLPGLENADEIETIEAATDPQGARRGGQQRNQRGQQVGPALDQHLESKRLLIDGAVKNSSAQPRPRNRPTGMASTTSMASPAIKIEEISARDRPRTRKVASSRLRVASAIRALL